MIKVLLSAATFPALFKKMKQKNKIQQESMTFHVAFHMLVFSTANGLFKWLRARDIERLGWLSQDQELNVNRGPGVGSVACSIHQNWDIDKLLFESFQTAPSATKWHGHCEFSLLHILLKCVLL